MAVTSIWSVAKDLKALLRYAENPEKTEISDLAGLHLQKKPQGEIMPGSKILVTCINCNRTTAYEEMTAVKKHFGKEDSPVAYHGFQSFGPGEVTPENAHEIGVRLATVLWGDKYQVLVATHTDKENHMHSHFVLNNVAMTDGARYHRTKKDYRRMRDTSDTLCGEYGLPVPGRVKSYRKSYTEHEAEKQKKPTLKGLICADIDRAEKASVTQRDFFRAMNMMGYEFKLTDSNGNVRKNPLIKPPGAKNYFGFGRLSEGYEFAEIMDRVYGNYRVKRLFEDETPRRTVRYRGSFKPGRRKNSIRAMYIYYRRRLDRLQKRPETYRSVHFNLREDLIKLDRINAETRLLAKNRIDTMEELHDYRNRITEQMQKLSAEREVYRKLVKRGDDSAKKDVSGLTAQLKILRRELMLCDGIEQRSERIKTVMKYEQEEREARADEHIGRSGRSGCENDIERS